MESSGMVCVDIITEDGIIGIDVDPVVAIAADGAHRHWLLLKVERRAVIAVKPVVGIEPYGSQSVLIDRED